VLRAGASGRERPLAAALKTYRKFSPRTGGRAVGLHLIRYGSGSDDPDLWPQSGGRHVRLGRRVTVPGMAQYGDGTRVRAVKAVHRSSGSAWPGTIGKVVKVTGDGYTIRWDNGGWHADTVKDHEIERA